MLILTQVIVYTFLIFSVYALIKTPQSEAPEKRHILISFLPLVVSSLISVTSYILTVRIVAANLAMVGIVFFVLIQLHYAIYSYLRIRTESEKSQIYRELIMIDAMTELNNRKSFEETLSIINHNRTACFIAVLDLNDLKYVNDTQGHQKGDEMIVNMANFLKHSYADYPSTQLYRIGGDEFVIIFYGNKLEFRDSLVKLETHTSELHMDYALGYSYYHAKSAKSIKDIFNEADQFMYLDKGQIKQNFGM